MKCETCKTETEKLFQERNLFFCSLPCFDIYIRVTHRWVDTAPMPIKEAALLSTKREVLL